MAIGKHRYRTLLHGQQGTLGFFAHQQARADGAQVTVAGMHPQRAVVGAGIDQYFTLAQVHQPLFGAGGNVDGTGAVELDFAAILQCYPAPLASGGAVVRHQGGQGRVVAAQPG